SNRGAGKETGKRKKGRAASKPLAPSSAPVWRFGSGILRGSFGKGQRFPGAVLRALLVGVLLTPSGERDPALVAGNEGRQVPGHGMVLFQRERSPEGGHHRPAALDEDADDLGVGARRLPAGVGKTRHARHVPDAAAVHAVAAEAIAVVQAGD